MVRVRSEVRSLGAGWNDTLLWYAKAVRALQARPFADPTSWRFLAAMHGWRPDIWLHFGVITQNEPVPSNAVQSRFMNQCQHQSWYFLPWHRGYVSAAEQILREAVVDAGGPDDWAMPYWNYSDPAIAQGRRLPDAFAAQTMPDGSANPLRVSRRFGGGTTPIVIPANRVTLGALEHDLFTGLAADIPPGFGGPETLFQHANPNGTNGGIESGPHNGVHGAIGGSIPGSDPNLWQNRGLMSSTRTAALDPIFWLHHANIDRLWTTWQRTNAFPTDANWLSGPSDREFVMPQVGGTEWEFTADDVLDTTAQPLDYVYDDEVIVEEMPTGPDRRRRRLEALEVPANEARGEAADEEVEMNDAGGPELIGAGAGIVRVHGETRDEIRMDTRGTDALRRSIDSARVPGNEALPEPARVFLKLEGIRGTADSANYDVYIDLPHGLGDDTERFAGGLSLFGVSGASDEDGPSAGGGITQVIEISEIIDSLHIAGDQLDALQVRLVPSNETDAAADFTIGQVSVYMLGA